MSSGVITLICSLLSTLLCAGMAFLFFCFVLGIILLRRRGKKNVTAREAVSTGVESVSMVFRRNADGELAAVTGEDEDDEAGEDEDK